MNVLDIEVSLFPKCTVTTNPRTVNLLAYLRCDDHRAAVERVRAIEDKTKRDGLKKRLLPGITPGGLFSERKEEGLVKPSGLMAGDIDFADNPYNPETIKRQVAKIPNVAYCGLSASGRGLWFLIPITCPDRYKEHFDALVADFARLGIVLDLKPANIASLRFCSYDPDACFNPVAVPYRKLKMQEPEPVKRDSNPARISGNDGEKLEAIVRQIEARRLDITGKYDQWFRLLCSLASLGEAGRDYAHRISRFHPKYKGRETDRQFTHCLRMKTNRFSLGTLLEVAKQYGVFYRRHYQ